jgi:hypothetical protein
MQAKSSSSSTGFDTAAYDAERLKLDEQVCISFAEFEYNNTVQCTCCWQFAVMLDASKLEALQLPAYRSSVPLLINVTLQYMLE